MPCGMCCARVEIVAALHIVRGVPKCTYHSFRFLIQSATMRYVDPVVVQVKVCAPENLQGAGRLEAQSRHGGGEPRAARVDLDEGALAAQQPLEPRDVLLDVRGVVVGRRLGGRLLRSEVLLGASPSHGQHLKSARGVAPSGPIAGRAHSWARETGPGRAISQRTWSIMLRNKIAKSGKITRCRKGSLKTWRSTGSRKRTV